MTVTLRAAEPLSKVVEDRSTPPNIVLIFIDDLGYGDIGPFGATKQKTPHLDLMAAEGRKFTSFYAAPVCSMSRACLLTGCYNTRVSIPGVLFPGNTIGLHADEITLAEVVQPQGYTTACIGKWHLGHRSPFLPTKHGFDVYFGIPYSNDMAIDPLHAHFSQDCLFREGMTEAKARQGGIRDTVPLMRGEDVVEYPADQSMLTKRYTQEAIEFITANKERPFFSICHIRWYTGRWLCLMSFVGRAKMEFWVMRLRNLTGRSVRSCTLRDLAIDSQTLVIFTSDNGADVGSSAPWRGKKEVFSRVAYASRVS